MLRCEYGEWMISPEEITILIIDDDDVVRFSLADYLEDEGYEVIQAENGQLGLATFQEEDVDLIIADLRMPEMGGLELVPKISKISPYTPIIVISGTGLESDSTEALERGAWAFFHKPITDANLLKQKILSVVEESRHLQAGGK